MPASPRAHSHHLARLASSARRGAAALLSLLLAACAPVPVEAPATPSSTPPPASTAIPHAEQIRFALVGKVNGGNVWAMFDSAGYSYNDYAIRLDYWPRLYHLTIPDGRFEPLAAGGMPSSVQPDGALFSATVPLRDDLRWSDGSPFSADDAAFTVNTALAFQLGFDWHAFYDPARLDHAEALDAHTLKFVFKQAPDVGAWQYGALQGPIVNKAYWQPRLEQAKALLPSTESLQRIEALEGRAATLQQRVQELVTSGLYATGEQARQLQTELQNQQGDLDQARNDLAKQEVAIQAAMQAAREAVYALSGDEEPLLGTWLPSAHEARAWVNTANPAQPFGTPNFDRAEYRLYANQQTAVRALARGEADVLLDPLGLSPAARSTDPGLTLLSNATSSMRAIFINPTRPDLADPALHRALFCAISRAALAKSVDAAPLTSLLGPGEAAWSNPEGAVACPGGYDPLTGPDEPFRAAEILRSAGYTWAQEPTAGQAGSGLQHPGGQPVRPLVLLAPREASDAQEAAAARFVEQAAAALGIPVSVQEVDPAVIRFAVLNGHDYDLAMLGWRAAAYPGYLCDWLGSGNALGYADGQVAGECAALAATSDLEAARSRLFNLQSLLAQDPPFIPVFAVQTYDISGAIVYPFDRVLNGLSGVYGAPSVAVPSAPPR